MDNFINTKDRIKLIWSFAKKYKALFFIAEICILITYTISLILPLNLTRLIDEVIKNNKYELIDSVILAYAILFVSSVLVNLLYSRIWQKIYNSFAVDVKCAVFKKVITAKAKELNKMNSGDVMSRIDVDSDQFNEAVFKNVFHFFNSFILCSGILIIIAKTNIYIALFILLGTLLPIIATRFFNRFTAKYTLEHRTIAGNFNGKLFEFFKGFRELKLQKGIYWSTVIIETTLKKLILLGNALKRVNLRVEKIIYFINLLISIFIYVISVSLISKKVLTIGGFLAIITYLALLHKKLNWMLRIWLDWHSRKISIDRVSEILKFESEDFSGENLGRIEKINVTGLCFGYYENSILKNVSFSIKSGEKVAVVGASGVGKTTLIGLLLKLYEPDTGSILMNNVNINNINTSQLRKRFCVVSQEIMLFDTTIRYNLTLGVDLTDDEVWSILNAVGLKETIEQLPNGLDFIFSKGNDLSGGQKQRLMIARAVLKKSDVYILDEATSALDVVNEKVLTDELLNNNILKTAIVISHRYEAIKNCDKVLVLKDGSIEAFYPMKEIRSKSLTFSHLFPLFN